jgi:Xaa-Pro aminopeptidase
MRRTANPRKRTATRNRIYVPGELGIRHEDTVVVTADVCENLGPRWSGTPEEPAVV